jgi:hypothetical protein
MYISRLVKTRILHLGLLSNRHSVSFIPLPASLNISSLALYSSYLFYYPFSLLHLYYLSILVEVLLRLLTYRGDLVLLYLVSEDHS